MSVKQPQHFVHQCPECKMWQVEYSEEDFLSYAMYRVEGNDLVPDLQPAYDAVEAPVAEHYRDVHPNAWAKWLHAAME